MYVLCMMVIKQMYYTYIHTHGKRLLLGGELEFMFISPSAHTDTFMSQYLSRIMIIKIIYNVTFFHILYNHFNWT